MILRLVRQFGPGALKVVDALLLPELLIEEQKRANAQPPAENYEGKARSSASVRAAAQWAIPSGPQTGEEHAD